MNIRLKDLRQSQKIYQSELAEILNITQSSVSRLELRPVATISYVQYLALCEKMGKEKVDEFVSETSDSSMNVSGNRNEGGGSQNNSISMKNDESLIDVIKSQSATILRMIEKQAEQTDRLLKILEKINGIG